jgi:LmbE family N-acetylglucosaminyl deacetylase
MLKKSKTRFHLVVVAHPDDELIFFGGLILRYPKRNWKVICLTDGNADGMGNTRQLEFNACLKALGVKEKAWVGLPDLYEKRLDLDQVYELLKNEAKPLAVYTHGPLGEYGHPHHQDTSYITHKVFSGDVPTWSPAWSRLPEKSILLTKKEFKKKSKIFTDIYGREAGRFLNLLPITAHEGFHRLQFQEVEYIYKKICSGENMDDKKLKIYSGLSKAISLSYGRMKKRLF